MKKYVHLTYGEIMLAIGCLIPTSAADSLTMLANMMLLLAMNLSNFSSSPMSNTVMRFLIFWMDLPKFILDT